MMLISQAASQNRLSLSESHANQRTISLLVQHKPQRCNYKRVSHHQGAKSHLTNCVSKRNSHVLYSEIIGAQNLSRRISYAQISFVRLTSGPRNPLISLNCAETELSNPLNQLNYNDSLELIKSLIMLNSGEIADSANSLIKFNSVEVTELSNRVTKSNPVNQLSLSESDSRPSLRGGVRHLCGTERAAQNYPENIGPVQCLGLLSSFRLISPSIDVDINCSGLTSSSLAGLMGDVASSGTRATGFGDLFFAVITKNSYRWWALVFLMVNCRQSLGFFRCRRLISPCKALTTNCPVLSFGSFSSSTRFTISCGTRTSIFFDFALIALVAMFSLTKLECQTIIHEFCINKSIDMSDTLGSNLCQTPFIGVLKRQRLRVLGTTTEASNHNVIGVNTMAIIQSTQTHPKFTPYFKILSSSDSKSVLSLRRPVNKKLLAEAQSWVKEIPGTWIWKLAVHKAKEAYGITESEPYPEVGDTRDNFVCTYSNPTAGEYIFSRKGSVVRHV